MATGELLKMALTDFSSLPRGVRYTIQVWVVTALFVSHIAWACGWIPGVSGFAFASDIDDVQHDLQALSTEVQHELRELTGELRTQRIEYLEERILSAYAQQCSATKGDLRDIHQRRLTRLLRHYQDVTAYTYPLQECEA